MVRDEGRRGFFEKKPGKKLYKGKKKWLDP